jgi:hypothetical protein
LEHSEPINALRFLSIDAVQKANSGHPGMPMGMAEIATALWKNHLNHNPLNPYWFNRDRFVLSNGHGSMLLYSLLHLTGYEISMDDLKDFRKLKSKTPGHPEYDLDCGVETTTGPLLMLLEWQFQKKYFQLNLILRNTRSLIILLMHSWVTVALWKEYPMKHVLLLGHII